MTQMAAKARVGALLPDQIRAIEICARTMSVLSLMGSCYIITTFLSFNWFRKPINRLVFYATIGNIMANVATLISTSGIPKDPGALSPLCEFQGVLIQWFMMADSLWVFCMATNVFLVFWYGYDAQQLRRLEKWYLLFAYGIPMVPAMVYVILDHHSQTRIIGSATLWCWVTKDVDWMRIAFFYGPVWIVIAATLTIYVATGIKIFRKGALLRFFAKESKRASENRRSTVVNDATINPFAAGKNIVVTTQIQHDVHDPDHGSHRISCDGDHESLSSYSSTKNLSRTSPCRETEVLSSDAIRTSRISRDDKRSTATRSGPHEPDDGTKSGYRATAFAANQHDEPVTLPPQPASAANNHRRSRLKKAVGNEAAFMYLKVAFLMFIALFVVWVPSTCNRLYQFIHKDKPSFALNIISAIVLPLQGAWNATIYIYTTRAESRRAYASIKSKLTGRHVPYQPERDLYRKDTWTSSRSTRDDDPEIQLEERTRITGHPRSDLVYHRHSRARA
ncbi:hypothetical protein EK21DRAFT_103825 [Setomelanomma holmii]|uniref:G-protein coupled receptors family 2 profile 2 domain-containing protein n=1 Tax=Setomelanomma holmii TaxID=210430 RepID=A0A9P4H1K5_9PLEO|nr:hypothetical protein EK21DRAFT_103825 [Setomelanomma holmii]